MALDLWGLGNLYRAQLFDISPLPLGLKRSHARCNVALSMPTNAVSIAILHDIGISRFVCDPSTLSTTLPTYVVVQGI